MNITVIINSALRRVRRRPLRTSLEKELAGHSLTIHNTREPGHATALAHEAAANQADVVVAVGGDGTANEILNGIIGSRTKLALIPAGTANDLATHFKIPEEIERACDVVTEGETRFVDVIRVNDWHYLTTAGIGLPCDVIGLVNRTRHGAAPVGRLASALQSRIYLCGLLLALTRRRREYNRLRIRFDHGRLTADALSLTISNLPALGRQFHLAPESRSDNGLLELCLIRSRGRARSAANCFSVARGKNGLKGDVKRLRLARATVESDRPVPFFGDGELRPAATEFDIAVLPRTAQLLVPKEAEDK